MSMPDEYVIGKVNRAWLKVRCPCCSHTIYNCLCSPDMIDDAHRKNMELLEEIHNWFGGKTPTKDELYTELVTGKDAKDELTVIKAGLDIKF